MISNIFPRSSHYLTKASPSRILRSRIQVLNVVELAVGETPNIPAKSSFNIPKSQPHIRIKSNSSLFVSFLTGRRNHFS